MNFNYSIFSIGILQIHHFDAKVFKDAYQAALVSGEVKFLLLICDCPHNSFEDLSICILIKESRVLLHQVMNTLHGQSIVLRFSHFNFDHFIHYLLSISMRKWLVPFRVSFQVFVVLLLDALRDWSVDPLSKLSWFAD